MVVDTTAILILIGVFFVLIILGTRVAFAMLSASILTILYLGLPLTTIISSLVDGVDGFTFLAIPFFVLAGDIMAHGGISDRLIKLSNAFVGWMRGGLAHVNIVASMFFGGISGSATADTASLGSILIPMMKKNRYDADFATTVTMASSVQGLLIPPSHNMVIFALAAGGSVSISQLFLGGIIPGIFLGLALMIYSYIISVIRKYPVGEPFSFIVLLKAIFDSIFGLGTVLIVVFGVVTGVFTATESAAIAVIYAFIITFFVYREIKIEEFWTILSQSVKTLSIIFVLIAAAGSFGFVIAFLKIPAFMASSILALTTNPYAILFFVNILLLIMGMMMGMAPIIIILTPILLPIVTSVGMDPVQFGIVMLLNCGIGLITPPVGGVLFVGSAVSKIKVEQLAKSMLPFYAVMFFVLLCITYFPNIVMFLPNLLIPK